MVQAKRRHKKKMEKLAVAFLGKRAEVVSKDQLSEAEEMTLNAK
jgi:hypothetical protein